MSEGLDRGLIWRYNRGMINPYEFQSDWILKKFLEQRDAEYHNHFFGGGCTITNGAGEVIPGAVVLPDS